MNTVDTVAVEVTVDLDSLEKARGVLGDQYQPFLSRLESWGLKPAVRDGRRCLTGTIRGQENWGSFQDQLLVLRLSAIMLNQWGRQIVLAERRQRVA